jgi:hypothetical protein
MGDKDKLPEGIKNLLWGNPGDLPGDLKPLVVAHNDISLAEEDSEPVTAPNLTLYEMFDIPDLPPKPIEQIVAIKFKPQTKRNVNYHLYEKRWRKATSLRKAKKYARILGENKTYNGKYTLGNFARMIILPRCVIEVSTEYVDGGFVNHVNVQPVSNP